MADWPDTTELAQVLNVDNVEDWETTLDRVLAAAIATTKEVRGNWDEYEDEPDEKLAQAALRMAELISQRPDANTSSLIRDRTFQTLMHGRRRVFGVA
jgi:hypothetical protein